MSSLAATHMDRMYRHQRHIYDASRKFYLLGRDSLINELQPPLRGRVLEIGCGTARNLTLAARVYPSANFYGVDVSDQMLITARRSIKSEGLADRVRVARGDATNVDPQSLFGDSVFDRVFISYALSMIPLWRETLDHALDLVAPYGSLHIVDFGDFAELPVWFGKGIRRWLGAFSVTPRVELEAELDQVTARRAMTHRVVRKFGGYAIHAVMVANGRGAGDDAHGRCTRNGEPSSSRQVIRGNPLAGMRPARP